ncbi:MAG TPA: cytochrome c3 family protein [Tepidisphaeraceae bacterium]|nr:cytochrome c3 family protein [Tepidisphaeraceae bacterium]
MKRPLPILDRLRDSELKSVFFILILVAIALMLALASWAKADITTSIRNTPHNLSASGPGTVKSTNEQQICIFCHTPHNATPIQPLWNRALPASAYRVYASNTLQAKPGQPTGSSKLCLSCHDGTIAVGSVNSRNQQIQMVGGITTLPPGASNLGTDLSDDHPISFRYDASLVSLNPNLRDPGTLPAPVQLDSNKELQCTSCHSAHDDSKGKFLVMDNSNSALCNSCHIPQGTIVQGHDQCADCHQNHTAPSGAHLLRAATVTDTCSLCHGGSAAPLAAAPAARIAARAPDVAAPAAAVQSAPPTVRASSVAQDLQKISRHNADQRAAIVTSAVGSNTKSVAAVNCADCHGSHSMKRDDRGAPNLPGMLGRVSGVTANGGPIATARFEYEVCFKCHGDRSTDRPYINRQLVQPNKRLQFNPSAVSFHPVEARGRNPLVPSLNPNFTPGSIIYCMDCHSSDSSRRAGGAGPAGPHGSDNRPLLVARYETTDLTSESASAYALCYRCHQRSSILGNESFPLHASHIVKDRTPCSICHDGHGIASAQGNQMQNAHLINFDVSIVRPDPLTKRLEYRQLGNGRGECFLLCHGKAHSPLSY